MLPLLERLEVDPGECCCCCCGVDDGDVATVATTVVEEDAPDDGCAAGGGGGGGGDVGCAEDAAEAPPLLTGSSCIVADVAAVSPGSDSLPTVAVVVLVSARSSPCPRAFFSSALMLASSPFLGLRDPAASNSGVTDGVFDLRDVTTADAFSTVLMGSLLDYTH